MSKAKTASKNNSASREPAREYFYNGSKIRPVKLISGNCSILVAEYDVSGDLVINSNGVVLPWKKIKSSMN